MPDFVIIEPPPPQTPQTLDTCVDVDGKVRVAIKDFDNHHYEATISVFTPGTGIGPTAISTAPLSPEGTGIFSAQMFAGTINSSDPPGPNRLVEVIDLDGAFGRSQGFRAIICHSGSGSRLLQIAQRCAHCSQARPVPAALQLQLDTRVEAGTCANCAQLNQPTLLVYTRDIYFDCTWISMPIDFCAESDNMGFWMLQKTDASNWMLTLRRGNIPLVTYRMTTRTARDCSFPIRLQIDGDGSSECRNWPRTVTIIPAP